MGLFDYPKHAFIRRNLLTFGLVLAGLQRRYKVPCLVTNFDPNPQVEGGFQDCNHAALKKLSGLCVGKLLDREASRCLDGGFSPFFTNLREDFGVDKPFLGGVVLPSSICCNL